MSRRNANQGHANIDLQFPLEGVDETRSFVRQRSGTTPDALNVVTFDPGSNCSRARGGSRSGLTRYFPGFAEADEGGGGHSIQGVTHFACNSTVQSNVMSIGQAVYSKGTSGGFDFVDSTGVAITGGPFGNTAGF